MYQHTEFQTVNSLFPLVEHEQTELLLRRRSVFCIQISGFKTRLSEEIFSFSVCLPVKTQKQTQSEAAGLKTSKPKTRFL